jgi:hypothetical protein
MTSDKILAALNLGKLLSCSEPGFILNSDGIHFHASLSHVAGAKVSGSTPGEAFDKLCAILDVLAQKNFYIGVQQAQKFLAARVALVGLPLTAEELTKEPGTSLPAWVQLDPPSV